jgi:hypothetical protein
LNFQFVVFEMTHRKDYEKTTMSATYRARAGWRGCVRASRVVGRSFPARRTARPVPIRDPQREPAGTTSAFTACAVAWLTRPENERQKPLSRMYGNGNGYPRGDRKLVCAPMKVISHDRHLFGTTPVV